METRVFEIENQTSEKTIKTFSKEKSKLLKNKNFEKMAENLEIKNKITEKI